MDEQPKTSKPNKRSVAQRGQGRGGHPARPKILSGPPISFRLGADDHIEFMAAVAQSGMRTTEYIRECVLSNETKVEIRHVAPSPEFGRVLYVVNKAGNNINQLAHRANLDNLKGALSEQTYQAILRELEYISLALRAVVNTNA